MADIKLASAGDDIKLWDCNAFTLLKQFNPHTHNRNVLDLAWSHDNTKEDAVSEVKIIQYQGEGLPAWLVRKRSKRQYMDKHIKHLQSKFIDGKLSIPDFMEAKLASVASGSDKIILTYPSGGNYSFELAVGEKRACLAFNSTSRYIVEGGTDGNINVWDLKSQKLKKSYKDHKGPISCLQFNWNDTDIASGSESGQIILYNVVSGQGSSPLAIPKVQQAVRCIQYSHFKKSLLGSVSDGGQVNLWDTNKRCLIHSFTETHKAPATGLAFSPLNEMLLLSVGLDKRIVCYDVQGKSAVRTMMAESPLTSIDLMHDGATIAVGSTRGKIFIYDLRQGATPVHTITAHKSSVQCLSFQYKAQRAPEPSGRSGTSTTPGISQKLPTFGSSSNINKPQDARPGVNGVQSSNPLSEINANNAHAGGSTETGRLGKEGADCGDVFSPIRDRISAPRWTPKSDRQTNLHKASSSPAVSQAGVPDISSDQRTDAPVKVGFTPNSSADKYVDGIFSPLSRSRDNSSLSHSQGHTATPLVSAHTASGDVQNVEEPLPTGSHLNSSPRVSGVTVKSPSRPPVSYRERTAQRPPQIRYSLPTPEEGQPASGDSLPPNSHLAKASSLPSVSQTSPSNQQVALPVTQDMVGAEAGGAVVLPVGGAAFQMEVLRNLVEEAVEGVREHVRRDVLNLHMDMLKQFQLQQEEMRHLLHEYHTANQQLIAERDRLREENSRLLKKY